MEDAEEIALSENFEKGKAEGKAELIQMMLKQGKNSSANNRVHRII
ncbi:hypothetical protein [Rickettsia felis]|nr:hypothetical protein [Rickettsia felis]